MALSADQLDTLWKCAEDNGCMQAVIGPVARKLEYATLEDNYGHCQFAGTPEDSYWVCGSTIALLILVAEGEELPL